MKVRTAQVSTRKRFAQVTSAALGFLAIEPRTAGAQSFQYKLGHDQPTSSALDVAAVQFANAVRRETNGRLNIRIFPDSTLGNDTSMVVQLRSGALEMHIQGAGPLSAIAPVAALGFTGFAFSQWRDAEAAMNGAVGAVIRKELEAKGLVVMEKAWPYAFQQLETTTKPIRVADDLNGMKLRVSLGPISVEMWKALGASAVGLSVSETYTALQTHLVDGTIGPFIDAWTHKTYEVTKYLSETNHQFSAYFFLVNDGAWNALPDDIRTIVGRNANIYAASEARSAELQGNASADQLRRVGMILNRCEAATFRARLSGYYARWKAEFGSTAWSALEGYAGKLA